MTRINRGRGTMAVVALLLSTATACGAPGLDDFVGDWCSDAGACLHVRSDGTFTADKFPAEFTPFDSPSSTISGAGTWGASALGHDSAIDLEFEDSPEDGYEGFTRNVWAARSGTSWVLTLSDAGIVALILRKE